MFKKIKQITTRWLRRSERYTKTDMLYLAKGGFWLTLGQIVDSLSALVLVIAFANLVPPETYGTYRYLLSIIGIIVVATFPGIKTAAVTSVARGDEQTFWALVKKKALWSLASSVIALGLTGYYYVNGNNILALSFLIAAVGVPIMYTVGMYHALLNGRKDFSRVTQWGMWAKIISLLAMLGAVLITDNAIVYIATYFLSEIVIKSFFLAKLYWERKTGTRIDFEQQKNLERFGFHLSLMEVIKTIAGHIDKILVFHYLGAAELAAYAIATTAPGQIKGMMQHLTTLALPKMSTGDAAHVSKTLPPKLLRLEIVIVFAIVGYWVVAPIVFPIIFPRYVNVIFLSQIYSLSLLFFPRTFFSTAMVAHHKQKEMYAIRVYAPLVRIAIFLVALPSFGLWGAVVGSIVGNAITAWIYQFFFRKAFQEPRVA